MYYQYDGTRNVTGLTNRHGEELERYRYDAFGNIYTGITAPYNAVGYTGQEYDEKSGLINMSASTTLAVFMTMLYYKGDVGEARTGAFVTLVLTQLIHVFECKSETKNIFQMPLFNNIYMVFAVLFSLVMILGVVYIPSLQTIFKTVPLGLDSWLVTGGLSFLVPVLASFFPARLARRRSRR